MSLKNLTLSNLKDPFLTMAISINQLMRGRGNNVSQVTLTANAGTTVVTDNNFQSQMGVWLSATTANAAAELGSGTIYVSAKQKGQFTLTHANNAQTDRTYDYQVLG
ncbi:MAG: hypothetical protein ACREHG_07955 [Candidatus Saccharimonadales bacterium]